MQQLEGPACHCESAYRLSSCKQLYSWPCVCQVLMSAADSLLAEGSHTSKPGKHSAQDSKAVMGQGQSGPLDSACSSGEVAAVDPAGRQIDVLAQSRFLRFVNVQYTRPTDGKIGQWQYVERTTRTANGVDGACPGPLAPVVSAGNIQLLISQLPCLLASPITLTPPSPLQP